MTAMDDVCTNHAKAMIACDFIVALTAHLTQSSSVKNSVDPRDCGSVEFSLRCCRQGSDSDPVRAIDVAADVSRHRHELRSPGERKR
jgi:hypothetical protein